MECGCELYRWIESDRDRVCVKKRSFGRLPAQKTMPMPFDVQPLNRSPHPFMANRATKQQIRELVLQHERHEASSERFGSNDVAVTMHDLVDDVVTDMVCSRRASPVARRRTASSLKMRFENKD